MNFIQMRSKSTGVISMYPEHYLDHPVFGDDLELFDPAAEASDDVEVDKAVADTHELPVEQRIVKTINKKETDNGGN